MLTSHFPCVSPFVLQSTDASWEGWGCVGMGEPTVQLPLHRHLLSDFTSVDQRHSHSSKGLGVHELCHQCMVTACLDTLCWILRCESREHRVLLPWACWSTTLCVVLRWHFENLQGMNYCYRVMLHCLTYQLRVICHHKPAQCRRALIGLCSIEGKF